MVTWILALAGLLIGVAMEDAALMLLLPLLIMLVGMGRGLQRQVNEQQSELTRLQLRLQLLEARSALVAGYSEGVPVKPVSVAPASVSAASVSAASVSAASVSAASVSAASVSAAVAVEPEVTANSSGMAVAAQSTPVSGWNSPSWQPVADHADTYAADERVWWHFVSGWMQRINPLAAVGVLILFMGVAFLLKLAVAHISFPIEVRYVAVLVAASGLLVWSRRLRETSPGYSQLVQGAALGIGYLTLFAAIRIHPLIAPAPGLLLLAGLCVAASVLALRQNSQALAMAALSGGFLAPILASAGSGSHIGLFGFYSLLNLGLLAMIWHRSWRWLVLCGFLFTFVIAVVWGVTDYRPSLWASTQPFLLLFIGVYMVATVRMALRYQQEARVLADGVVVFGTPVAGFGLQMLLVDDFEYGAAWSALGLGLTYLLLVYRLWQPFSERAARLREAWLAIGLVLLSLTFPLALSSDLSALLWALEGAGALWYAHRLQRRWGVILAVLAQLLAAAHWYLSWLDNRGSPDPAWMLNTDGAGSVLIALVGLFSASVLQDRFPRVQQRFLGIAQKRLSDLLLCWGLGWWFGGFWIQTLDYVREDIAIPVLLVIHALSWAVLGFWQQGYHWTLLRWLVLCSVLPVSMMLLWDLDAKSHPFASGGWLAWPLTIAVLWWLLNRCALFVAGSVLDAAEIGVDRQKRITSLVAVLLVIVLAGAELGWQADHYLQQDGWVLICLALPTLLLVILIDQYCFWRARLDDFYRQTISAGLYGLILLDVLLCCFVQPDLKPLGYWPLFNPLDLWQIAALILSASWWLKTPLRQQPLADIAWRYAGDAILAITAFCWLNSLLLRTLHTLADIPYSRHALFHSSLVQTGLSILWSALAVVLLMMAVKQRCRSWWLTGAALFAIVIIKLFVIDLDSSGTVERVVSFIGVGLLMLGVGYLAPLPALSEGRDKVTG
jgi:uncharacterized membrane protein